MGADAPIPPNRMNGRRPEGRPAAASITYTIIRIQSPAQRGPDRRPSDSPHQRGGGGIAT